MEKPDVDRIDGISPAIAIRQKNTIRNPRSTVGTTTEIHDYLRLLYARIGRTFCRTCGREVVRETAEVVARELSALPSGTRLLLGFDLPIVEAPAVNVVEVDELAEIPDDAGADPHVGPEGNDVSNGADTRVRPYASSSTNSAAIATAVAALRKKGFARLLVGDRAVAFDDVDAAALVD